MSSFKRRFVRWIAIIYLATVHAAAIAFVFDHFIKPRIKFDDAVATTVGDPTESTPIPTPPDPPEGVNAITETPSFEPNAQTQPLQTPPQIERAMPDPLALIIPVAGVRSSQLQDTFSAARSGGRVHNAIDIMAPSGTQVLAAADGKIVKFFNSVPGGITIYQLSRDQKYVYYYAHLQRRADGLSEGDEVKQGQTIAFVGDTGNAGTGNFHLHFSIYSVTDPTRFWDGENVNPFPILKGVKP